MYNPGGCVLTTNDDGGIDETKPICTATSTNRGIVLPDSSTLALGVQSRLLLRYHSLAVNPSGTSAVSMTSYLTIKINSNRHRYLDSELDCDRRININLCSFR